MRELTAAGGRANIHANGAKPVAARARAAKVALHAQRAAEAATAAQNDPQAAP